MTAIILALAVMFAQSPAERKARMNDMILEAPSTRTIEKGDQSNVDDARQVLVRTDAEWTKLWQQHASDRPRPGIDFSKEMVVGVFMGSRPKRRLQHRGRQRHGRQRRADRALQRDDAWREEPQRADPDVPVSPGCHSQGGG